MPRSRHEKQASPEAVEAYKKIIQHVTILKKQQPKLRVMFQDEAGFGRINKPKRCWDRQGICSVVPCHHIREYRYLYGAVSPEDGELFSLVMPYTNTECMLFALNFYQQEPVSDNRSACTYQVFFRDASGKAISDTIKIIADKANENGQERTFRCTFNLKPQQYDRLDTYYLVIQDSDGKQPPIIEEFQIDIAFSTDGFDFFS